MLPLAGIALLLSAPADEEVLIIDKDDKNIVAPAARRLPTFTSAHHLPALVASPPAASLTPEDERSAAPVHLPALVASPPAASPTNKDERAAAPAHLPAFVASPPAASLTPEDERSAAPVDAAPADAVTTVILRAEGVDEPALRAALARRRPDLTLLAPGRPSADPTRTAYVEVIAALPSVTLDLVHADGRAWRRTLDVGDAPGERAAARLIVQLLAAIAERRAEPERRDVPVPAWTRDPDADRLADAPTAAPEPAPPQIPDPPPTDSPTAVPEHAPPQIPDPPPTAPRPSIIKPEPAPEPAATNPTSAKHQPEIIKQGYELGLTADFTTLLGPGPPRDVSPLRGLGGGLRLDLRFPRALVLGLAVRGLARDADGIRLSRLRGALSLGYLLRHRRLEFLIIGALSFETWRARQQGDPVYYAEPGADTRPLLIGGLVRAAPGVRLVAGPRLALRLGAFVEFAASLLPTGAAAKLSRTFHDGAAPTPLFALGGPELAAGLDLAAWFTLRRR
ncbi:MAG: hypothetical protein JNL82_27715 [Myxococcales bacterium]|nr:hypothetical protein [Myxococcales bacterium]